MYPTDNLSHLRALRTLSVSGLWSQDSNLMDYTLLRDCISALPKPLDALTLRFDAYPPGFSMGSRMEASHFCTLPQLSHLRKLEMVVYGGVDESVIKEWFEDTPFRDVVCFKVV